MTDPKRWSDGSEATELERELLVAGQSVGLPESERRALWASIALSLPAAPPPPTLSPQHAAAGASGAVVKAVLVLATLAGVSVGAAHFMQRGAPSESAPKARAAASAASAVDAPASSSASASATVTSAAPSVPAPPATPGDSKARPLPASQLREESLALLEARAALRSGDAARSLALLEQSRQRFARGALSQEREALTIQALSQSGDKAAARRRAQAFLRAHPQSPYVADVHQLARP
jgi:hypothetical protein